METREVIRTIEVLTRTYEIISYCGNHLAAEKIEEKLNKYLELL